MHAEKTVIFQTYRLLSDKEHKMMLGKALAYTTIRTRLSEHTLLESYQNTYISHNFMHIKSMNSSSSNFLLAILVNSIQG